MLLGQDDVVLGTSIAARGQVQTVTVLVNVRQLLDRYKTAVAIVLMLGCHGHTGYAQFKDISLQFAVGKYNGR